MTIPTQHNCPHLPSGWCLDCVCDFAAQIKIWQPIENAPKTGYVMGAWKDGKWCCREMLFDDVVGEWICTSSDRYYKPTHWAPVPGAYKAEVS